MKTLCAIIIGILTLMPTHRAVPDNEVANKADYFTKVVASNLENKGTPLTGDEKATLKKAHPILLKIADQEQILKHLWLFARQAEPEEIAWDKAKEMILAGKITFASQSHSLDVHLYAFNGRAYKTKEPVIDDVYKAIKEVDPKGVFIQYMTE